MKTQILKKQVIKIFQKFGFSKDHALISSNALINAEMVGAYGHGLSRLKMYCDRISKMFYKNYLNFLKSKDFVEPSL